jgi:hypothetical protein
MPETGQAEGVIFAAVADFLASGPDALLTDRFTARAARSWTPEPEVRRDRKRRHTDPQNRKFDLADYFFHFVNLSNDFD